MTKLVRVVGVLIAGCTLSSACSDPSQPAVQKPATILSVAAEATRHPLVEAVNVTFDSASAAEITYKLASGAQLTVTADSLAKSHVVFLTRLRSGSTYTYEVRARTANGTLGVAQAGSFATASLPAGLADMTFSATGTPTRPVTLIQISAASNRWFGMVAVDDSGKVVWYHRTATGAMGFVRRTNGEVAIIDKGIVIIGKLGDTIAALPPASATTAYENIHHAVTNSPTGTILFVANSTRVINDTSVIGDAVWEWNPVSGALAKKWDAFDHLNWKTDRGGESGPGDWLHANAISVGAHGNYILGFRNTSQVISISADWNSIEWRIGGQGSTITVPDDAVFSGQHGAHEISPGHLLMFDNGFSRPLIDSRAMELTINTATHSATKTWEYSPSPKISAQRLGSVQRFANGNSFIDFGWLEPDPIQIVEVSASGQTVWRLQPANSIISKIYAADPLESLFGEH